MKTSNKYLEHTNLKPILIVDKIGVIGESLAVELAKNDLVFFVSKRKAYKAFKNIVSIPFVGKVPKIPNNLYSKLIIFDDGNNITRKSVSTYIKKAKMLNVNFYFVGSLRNMDLEKADLLTPSYEKAKVLIFGDLFDKEILFDKETTITKYIINIKNNNKIKVPNEGLALNYPISFEDTIRLIIKAVSIEIPQKTILLFAQQPITDISLANTFQKIDPDIKVDFEVVKKKNSTYFPKDSKFALSKYDLKSNLEKINFEKDLNIKVVNKNEKSQIKYFKQIVFFIIACIFILLLPLITTGSYVFLGNNQIEKAKTLFDKGEFNNALKKSENAKSLYEGAKKTSEILYFQMNLIGYPDRVELINAKIEGAISTSIATSKLLESSIIFEKIYSGKSGSSTDDLDKSINLIKDANSIIYKSKVNGQIPKGYEDKIENILPYIEFISNNSEAMPLILGFIEPIKYLILIQNDLEIRPGGGVLESVGLITLRNGKVENFEINEASYFDSKPHAYKESPNALKKYLAMDSLKFRDSSIDPDFENSAFLAASIYSEVSNSEIDGVIGVNLSVLMKLWQALNSKEFNKDKVADSWENESVTTFKNVADKIKTTNQIPFYTFMQIIGNSISEKDILLTHKNSDIQNILNINKFSGKLADNRISRENVINDYFGISEANIGLNKINSNIERSIKRNIFLDNNNQLNSMAAISFKNNTNKNSEKGGAYLNYLQVILPRGAIVKEVSLGGKTMKMVPYNLTRSDLDEDEIEVEEKISNDKSIFGFVIGIPAESEKTFKINYLLPFVLNNALQQTAYSSYIYKQPGIKSFSYEQAFNLPNNYSILPDKSYLMIVRKDEEIKSIISNN